MSNLAERRRDESSLHDDGYVVHLAGPQVTVRLASEVELVARRALSCLVAPELGDRVLLARLGSGESFVLAVLERTDDARVRLGCDRDLVVESLAGRVDVVGAEGVGVVGPRVQISGDKVELRSVETTVAFDSLYAFGQRVLAETKKATLLGEVVETVADVMAQRLKRAYRVVKELEVLRAGSVDHQAEKVLRVHSENAFITAEQVVKLDGENIHLG